MTTILDLVTTRGNNAGSGVNNTKPGGKNTEKHALLDSNNTDNSYTSIQTNKWIKQSMKNVFSFITGDYGQYMKKQKMKQSWLNKMQLDVEVSSLQSKIAFFGMTMTKILSSVLTAFNHM